MAGREDQYVGPYKLEKTLGKGQTGNTSACMLGVFMNHVVVVFTVAPVLICCE